MTTFGARDVRAALRNLFAPGGGRSNRGLTILAIVTLALGIGANTAIFSVIDRVLLEPLPYANAGRLVQVWNTYPLMDLPQASVSVPDYIDRRADVDAFDESALYNYVSVNLAGREDGRQPERVVGVRTTASLEVDPGLPLYDVTTLEEQIGESLAARQVSMGLVAIFGALALILAAVGIYGVLAFSTAQREREIGTRMALGASPGAILRLIVGQGMGLTTLGVALGIALALALGRVVRSMLFGVTPWDPVTYGAAGAILLAVSLYACYRPARRASTVDPVEALRSE